MLNTCDCVIFRIDLQYGKLCGLLNMEIQHSKQFTNAVKTGEYLMIIYR